MVEIVETVETVKVKIRKQNNNQDFIKKRKHSYGKF